MDQFTTNFHHGGKFILSGGRWSYVGGSIRYLNAFSLDTFSYFELEKDVKVIYAGIKRIAYLKPEMSFSEGITFFGDGYGCWNMLSWVTEGEINVYCECIEEKANGDMNEVEEIHGESAHIDGENSIVGVGGDDDKEDRQYFIEFQREVSQYRER